MKLSKFRIPFLIFFIGLLCYIIGALFKIQHWPRSSEFFSIATILEIIAAVLTLFIVFKNNKPKN